MGRRSEQRNAIAIPVIVRGTDSSGNPFVSKAETRDVSVSGARLQGLNGAVKPGSKLEIECRGEKAWFRVQWIGAMGTQRAGDAGLRCLEPGKYIWGVQPKLWEPDTFDPSQPEILAAAWPTPSAGGFRPPEWKGRERRRFPRRACRMEAQVVTDGTSVHLSGNVTDISLDGCYVEMLLPLPVGTLAQLSLHPGNTVLHMTGKVRSSQTGMGMGVEFMAMSPEDFEKLREFTPPTPQASDGSPGASCQDGSAEVRPRHIPTTAEALDAIVAVLSRKGLMTRTELSEELEKLKTIKA